MSSLTQVNPFEPQAPLPSSQTGGNVFGDYMQAFFSQLPPGQQQQIWVGFLQQFFPNAPLSTPPPTDTGTQQLFIAYVKQVFDSQQYIILSPDEIKKRSIMLAVLATVIDVLSTLQTTVGLEATALAFYGQWQEQYTHQMANVPIYVGGESSDVVVPAGPIDASTVGKITFGYDNISVADLANWYAFNQTSPSGDPSAQFMWQSYIAFPQNVNGGPGSVSDDPFGSNDGGAHNTGFGAKLTVVIQNGAINTYVNVPAYNSTGDSPATDSKGNLIYETDNNGLGLLVDSTAIAGATDFTTSQANFNSAFADFWNGTGFGNAFNADTMTKNDAGDINLAANTINAGFNAFNSGGTGRGLVNAITTGGNIHTNPTSFDNVVDEFINDPQSGPGGVATPVNPDGGGGVLNKTDFNVPDSIQASPILNQIFRRTNFDTDPNAFFQIAKPYTFVAPASNTDGGNADHNLSDSNSKSRAELNSRDQQYIENIRSNRQVVQDAGQQIQSNLSQSQQEVTQQADLFIVQPVQIKN